MPIVPRRRSKISRLPRPLGQIFINPPELGISEDAGINESTLRPRVKGQGKKVEICTAEAVHARRVRPSELHEAAIEQPQWDRYGPALRISESADRYLRASSQGLRAKSVSTFPRDNTFNRNRIPRKPVPVPPRSSSEQPVAQVAASGTFLARSWSFQPAQEISHPASLTEKHPRLLDRMTRSSTQVELEERRPSMMGGFRTILAKGARTKLREPKSKVTGDGFEKVEDSAINVCGPLETCPPAQLAVSTLAVSPVQVLVETLPVPPSQEPVLELSASPAQSQILVQAETVPVAAAPHPIASQGPEDDPAVATAAQRPGSRGVSMPRLMADLTQCVNRLGKRLVDEADHERRKQLYAVS